MGNSFKENINKYLFIVFILLIMSPFFLMIIGIETFDANIENRSKTEKPLIAIETLSNFPEKYESYFNDIFVFRSSLIQLNSLLKAGLLNSSTNKDVLMGKNGWLFIETGNNIDIYRNVYPLTDESLTKIVENQIMYKEYFESIGAKYILVLAPSKVSVYPEYLPDGGKYSSPYSIMDKVSDKMAITCDLTVFNTKRILLENKKNMLLFYKKDTHWNYLASYLVYKNLCTDYLSIDPINNVVEQKSKNAGDLNKMLGLSKTSFESISNIKIMSPKALLASDDSFNLQLNNICKESGYGWTVETFYNKNGNGKRLLIFGDSFFTTGSLRNYLAENYSIVVVLRTNVTTVNYNINKKLVNYIKPDVVIMGVTERLISFMSQDLDNSFIYESKELKFRELNNTLFNLNINDNITDFSKVSNANILATGNQLEINATTNDPMLFLHDIKSINSLVEVTMKVSIHSEVIDRIQLFYLVKDDLTYNEKNSISINYSSGNNIIYFNIPDYAILNGLRIDPGTNPEKKYIIESIEIKSNIR